MDLIQSGAVLAGAVLAGAVLGGKQRVTQDATLVADLLSLLEPDARGDPMWPLRWTCQSISQLTRALVGKSHRVGRTLVRELSRQQKFSLQSNQKTREGDPHPDREAQFRHLNESVWAALAAGEPVISVDTKKKELVGDFKNAGREWRPHGQPKRCGCMTFSSRAWVARSPPDLRSGLQGRGIRVGMSSDTSAFAVQTIRRWWQDGRSER